MIKAVFFDWFNTLARYDPPREELYCEAFKEYGIDLSISEVNRGLKEGDREYFAKNPKSLVIGDNSDDRSNRFVIYAYAIGKRNGIDLSHETALNIIKKVLLKFKYKFVLFDDVLPVLKQLKNQGITTGIITNAENDIVSIIVKLDVKPYIDVIITSEEVKAEKPATKIFLAALERAGVKASEMIYVGDQYKSDILGANSVGINALLIDRYRSAPASLKCFKIETLRDIPAYF